VVLSTPQQTRVAAAGVDQLSQELAAHSTNTTPAQKNLVLFTAPYTIQQSNQGFESLEAEVGVKVEQSLTRRRRAGTRS
jgi:hypothetical protein